MKPLVTTDIDLENQEANANDNDEEQERLTLIVRQGERLEDEERDYDDYYDHISRSPSIRPITVTEGVNFSRMRIGKKILWWCITTLNLLSCIVLSVRTDRLLDWKYLSKHKLHYGFLLLFALVSWSPQIYDTLSGGVFHLSNKDAFIICVVGNFYYFATISIFFKFLIPRMRKSLGVPKTLKFWEFLVSSTWQAQTCAFWVLTITPPVFESQLEPIPSWLSSLIGISLFIAGICSKMGALFWTGYNTYYWYDMVTDIPNAYFVQGGIYKFVDSPTYTLGRGASFGTAIYLRSVPMFFASILDIICINLFNHFIEQPSVEKMYNTSN